MDEMEYYDAGIKVGKKYEQKRILRFLEEKKKRNAKVVSISELTEFIEDGGRFMVAIPSRQKEQTDMTI